MRPGPVLESSNRRKYGRECHGIATVCQTGADGTGAETERAYVSKVKAFMAVRDLKCLEDFANITGADVEAHLTDLAVDGYVAASTQNAAFHGLLSFFTLVLKRDMGRIEAIRAGKGKQIPTVMSTQEVTQVFDGLSGVHLAIAELLYGCGLRISEAIRLRIKDLDFDNRRIEIHQSKGGKSGPSGFIVGRGPGRRSRSRSRF